MQPELAIIIPCLNEAENLATLLPALKQQTVNAEIIVADGGSSDDSLKIAKQHGAKTVSTAAGRGQQMNAGAAVANAAILLFLHADCRPTRGDQLRRAIAAIRAKPFKRAGHFPLRFVDYPSKRRSSYRFLEAKSRLNRPHTTNGDQGLLIYRAWFEDLGGFDEAREFLEDQEMGRLIRRDGAWFTLPDELTTSARRFETEGFRARYTLMTLIMAAWHCRWQAFFDTAPGIYRAQAATEKMSLGPFLAMIRTQFCKMALKNQLQLVYQVGDYARQNFWQLPFGADVLFQRLTGIRRAPLLWLHDVLLKPLGWIKPLRIAATCLCGGLAMLWLFGLITPWYAMTEKTDRRPE